MTIVDPRKELEALRQEVIFLGRSLKEAHAREDALAARLGRVVEAAGPFQRCLQELDMEDDESESGFISSGDLHIEEAFRIGSQPTVGDLRRLRDAIRDAGGEG